jgi:cobalt-zinc-cadmium efflux system membrane fusion protein
VLAPVLVFSALGGLLVWGQMSDWTMPKFSALIGNHSDENNAWCAEHNVPESECVECNEELLPRQKDYGWCERHGVHQCPLDHPEIAQTATPAHVTAEDFARADRALELGGRPRNNSRCKAHERRIQFTSNEAAERAGIKVLTVARAPMVEFATANGEIAYDQTRTARLSSRAPGAVFRAFKSVGDPVAQDEVIALVAAAEVGKAKSEFLLALAQFRAKTRTHARLAASASIPDSALREAETALSEAKIRLITAQQSLVNLGLPVQLDDFEKVADDKLAERVRFLGLPVKLADSLDPNTTTGNLLTVTAPFKGIVVNRDFVAGEVVDTAKILFTVADVDDVWLMLDLRAEDVKRIRRGQKVHFRPDSGNEEAIGSIDWISTEADHKTRTVKARAILDNTQGHLRANTFGTAKVILREEPKAIVVPNDAVHWEGDCYVVFVRDKNYLKPGAPKVFHTRTVLPGAKDGEQTEIIAGVLPGEIVASSGSAVLRAELLRGNLGEG